jgi:hypothetical protein
MFDTFAENMKKKNKTITDSRNARKCYGGHARDTCIGTLATSANVDYRLITSSAEAVAVCNALP